MMTIQICENVTATLTTKTLNAYWDYQDAVRNLRTAFGNENLDWEDYEDLYIEVDEAWARFCP